MIRCVQCGQDKEEHKDCSYLCVECYKASNNLVAYKKRSNDDWIGIAEQAGLELWERQPAETEAEWAVWVAYRAYYPGRRPTMRFVAEQARVSVGMAQYAKNRWDFNVRMQAWAKHIDDKIIDCRYDEILSMNDRQTKLAEKIQSMLEVAVDNINVDTIKPNEISRLLQISSELERKARVDGVNVSERKSERSGVVVPGKKTTDSGKLSADELREVMGILTASGAIDPAALSPIKKVTVEVQREELPEIVGESVDE